jgi:hypothetical protein
VATPAIHRERWQVSRAGHAARIDEKADAVRPRSSHLRILICATLLGFAGPLRADPAPSVYDPLDGVEASGRIPKPTLPADLPNPERWRYIPEGRIKPGNVFSRLMVSSFLVPFVFVESDVGFGGGLALTDVDFRQKRRKEFAGFFVSYTTKGQQA